MLTGFKSKSFSPNKGKTQLITSFSPSPVLKETSFWLEYMVTVSSIWWCLAIFSTKINHGSIRFNKLKYELIPAPSLLLIKSPTPIKGNASRRSYWDGQIFSPLKLIPYRIKLLEQISFHKNIFLVLENHDGRLLIRFRTAFKLLQFQHKWITDPLISIYRKSTQFHCLRMVFTYLRPNC